MTEPNEELGTQKAVINFNTPKREQCFTGEMFFHTPEKVKYVLEKSGFMIHGIYEPLATENDIKNFPYMWGDEKTIPFHLVVMASKHF